MTLIRCQVCRTLAHVGPPFCFACGARYDASAPRVSTGSIVEREAARDRQGSGIGLAIFAVIGAVGAIFTVLGVTSGSLAGALLAVIIAITLAVSLWARYSPTSTQVKSGKDALTLFAVIGGIFTVVLGGVILLFAMCCALAGGLR